MFSLFLASFSFSLFCLALSLSLSLLLRVVSRGTDMAGYCRVAAFAPCFLFSQLDVRGSCALLHWRRCGANTHIGCARPSLVSLLRGKQTVRSAESIGRLTFIQYSGGTASSENFPADFSTSAVIVADWVLLCPPSGGQDSDTFCPA